MRSSFICETFTSLAPNQTTSDYCWFDHARLMVPFFPLLAKLAVRPQGVRRTKNTTPNTTVVMTAQRIRKVLNLAAWGLSPLPCSIPASFVVKYTFARIEAANKYLCTF